MAQQYTNYATGTLASTLTNVGVTATLSNQEGDLFPAINSGAGEFMVLTLEDASGLSEIVKCVGRSGNTFNLDGGRGWEGTSARTWPAGSRMELRLTAGVINEFIQRNNDTLDGGTY